MKQKITVSIAGQEYTMVAEEDEAYVQRCAAMVDSQVREVMGGARLGLSDAAVLAAMNIADQFYREQDASENLRRQIKDCPKPSGRFSSSRAIRDKTKVCDLWGERRWAHCPVAAPHGSL